MKRHSRIALVALGIETAFLLGSLGCQSCSTGQVNPAPYSCGNTQGVGAPCLATVSFCCGSPPSGGFFPPSILGYHTNIYINDQISAGDGSIGHFLQLTATPTSYIMAGYENIANTAILSGCTAGFNYFLEVGPTHTCLGTVPQADFAHYAVVTITPNGSDPTNPSSFNVSITNQATNLSHTVNVSLWAAGSSQFANVQLGERLVGSQGASTGLVLFLGNFWEDSKGHFQRQSYDGGVTANNPPFGDWLRPPSQSASAGDGGVFYTECCLPRTVLPDSLDFDTVTIGTTSAPQTVTVTNRSSTGTLNIIHITITGTNAGDFVIGPTTSCSAGSFAPLASCTISVTFSPSHQGPESANLLVTDSGGSGSGSDSASLSGVGQ